MTSPGEPTIRKVGPGPVVLRELRVARTEQVAARMMRVTLGGDSLAGFESPGADDHVVLFFLDEGQPVPEVSEPGERPVWDVRPPTRDYTPRRFDADSGELDVDFVLHGAGVASTWAERATTGSRIAIGGPRTSFLVDGFDHLLLIGDESAIPSIARRVEELTPGTTAHVVIEVRDSADEAALGPAADRAGVDVTWVHRGEAEPGTTTGLLDAVRSADVPSGSVFASAAAETEVVRTVRHHLLAERGLRRDWVRTNGYWKREV